MATLNVPGTYPTVSAAVAAAASGDTILVAAGYGGNEAVNVSVNNLTFSAPGDVPNIALTAGAGVLRITLDGDSPIRIIGNTSSNTFIGNAGANDISDGAGGNDTIDGGGGNDSITSSGGTDTLRGGEGDDRFFIDDPVGGTVNGGNGTDTVFTVDPGNIVFSNVEVLDTYYGFITARLSQIASFGGMAAVLGAPDTQISVSLRGAGGTLDFTTRIVGENSLSTRDAGLTSAIKITGSVNDDFLFGSNFNDTLRGGDGADILVGGNGRDTLIGNAGADTLSGGVGNDVLTGNGDGDTATYFDASGVRVSLAITSVQNTLSAGKDTLSGISNLIGSDYDDRLSGDGNANRLDGGAGNDTLLGDGGDDTLDAGDGDDRMSGGAGADILDGGAGTDRAEYDDATAGLLADLQDSSVNTGFAAGDTYVSVEDLLGSAFGDILRGDAGDNGILGQDGDDTLLGRDGNDRLLGGLGGDALDGGAGTDRAEYGDAAGGVLADLQDSSVNTGIAAGDTYVSVENLLGSASGDELRGDAGDNGIWGQAGDDTLLGRDGNDSLVGGGGIDTLSGGDGNDRLSGGVGGDALDGGTGTDRAEYGDAAGGVLADLQDSSVNTGIAAGDTYVSVENLLGSASGDELRGDAGDNGIWGQAGDDTLLGRDGNDSLVGGGGIDTLSGGDGNDRLSGGVGGDALDGGTGTDRAEYGDAAGGVLADLQDSSVNTGIAAGDTYVSVENLLGSAFGDELRGDAGNNGIWGQGGGDTLLGRDGDDTLLGGGGNDTLDGGNGNDVFVFDTALDAATNVDTIVGFSVANDTIRLDGQVFAALSLGVLAADAFVTAATAQDAEDRIIYDSATGATFYDADGNGSGSAIQFATLDAGLGLTNNDFLVV